MFNFDITKIHETVWVFNKAIQNSDEIIDYFENNSVWNDWYTFGKMTNGTEHHLVFNEFPSEEEWNNKINQIYKIENKKNNITKTIDSIFYETTKKYLSENNIKLKNWIYQGWNIAKYNVNENEDLEYAMLHHTDYQRELLYNPEINFGITAVFYLNENYDGGEVEFRFIEDESLEKIKEDYCYKPKAGDVVVFLSGHPHYHAVRSILNGEKYIIRTYWKFIQDAHPRWQELSEKYGDEVWRQMEEDRLFITRTKGNQKIINNIPKYIEFEEYYNENVLDILYNKAIDSLKNKKIKEII